ncbi:MAG: hypothetical protein KZQ65_11700, partial [Candidatus Thiodiazotropha sp. (ex Gloverina cf. vestifex)]|nr:hypothetical protein [Candidatus Thiodiazotropha sp. (ex Gloverina cf. vestifex)]
ALFFFAHGSFEASERKRSLTNDSFRASLDNPLDRSVKRSMIRLCVQFPIHEIERRALRID